MLKWKEEKHLKFLVFRVLFFFSIFFFHSLSPPTRCSDVMNFYYRPNNDPNVFMSACSSQRMLLITVSVFDFSVMIFLLCRCFCVQKLQFFVVVVVFFLALALSAVRKHLPSSSSTF